MKRILYAFALAATLLACQKDQPTVTPSQPVVTPTTPAPTFEYGSNSVQLTLGNPSRSTTNPDDANNFLLIKDQYVVSYNRTLGRANWVSWHLQKSDLGTTDRQDDFRPDNSLPAGWYQVKPTDYTTVDGFDRGHLCPSGDRTNLKVNNSATFLMTNMIPQAPTLNRGVWQELESYCRQLVQEGNELYITAGGYGEGATGSQGYKTILASGKVKPPTHCWKVIVVLPEGDNDLARINTQSTVIAVDMLNSQMVREGWEDYIVTISDVERATNYTLLSALPTSTQSALKAKKYSLATTTTPPTSATNTPPTSATVTPPVTTTTTPPVAVTTSSPTTSTVTPPATTTTTPPTTATITPPTSTTTAPPSTPPTSTTTASPSTTPPTTGTITSGDQKCGFYKGRQLYRGPQGGCYYINSNGNKTYVDRDNCSC